MLQYQSLYEGLNLNIKRADLARYLLLLKFGGLYMDLDIQLKSDILPIFSQLENAKANSSHTNASLFITYISKEFELLSSSSSTSTHNQQNQKSVSTSVITKPKLNRDSKSNSPPIRDTVHFAGNAFFAAQSGSPVLKAMIEHIIGFSNPKSSSGVHVLQHTGPLGLGSVIHTNPTILKSSYLTPFSHSVDHNNDINETVVVFLPSNMVGNTNDRPSIAEHKRKHRWS
eukprot:CAMPEP_0170088068 /NCGR_PEP_ID=MMETSP0019_2-20121128/22403_1 /TAXON_ID=98059 /ORGANISM="Dinobryon sp., Strain UTEXLB2267" /LENGTH=227 /DNA_ID=CAMNT_0010306063 /DNA_START=316 /DNA_END=999 /DNA_ORIENTATION=+